MASVCSVDCGTLLHNLKLLMKLNLRKYAHDKTMFEGVLAVTYTAECQRQQGNNVCVKKVKKTYPQIEYRSLPP